MPKVYGDKEFKKDLNELANLLKNDDEREGGAKKRKLVKTKSKKSLKKSTKKTVKKQVKKTKKVSTEKRHFRIVEINGKAKEAGDFYVSKKSGTPSGAARKALRTVCKVLGFKGSKKVGCKVTFSIQEITRGSKNKIYGPYKGTYKSVPKSEQLVSRGGVKILVKVKPVVKLISK